VRRVIYTSSTSAIGYGPAGPHELPFDESTPCRPDDLYGITKHVGEQICDSFRRREGLTYVALRPGCFIPIDEMDPQFGFGLLSHRVHWTDVVRAHVLALRSDAANEAIIITPQSPFAAEDAAALMEDPAAVVRERFPEVARLEEHGARLPQQIGTFYSIERAKEHLGYRPQWSFPDWLEKKLSS